MSAMTPAECIQLITNAANILSLRLSDDEWSQTQGRKIGAGFSDRELVAAILTTGATLLAEVDARAEVPS